jgi:hypothetical protein
MPFSLSFKYYLNQFHFLPSMPLTIALSSFLKSYIFMVLKVASVRSFVWLAQFVKHVTIWDPTFLHKYITSLVHEICR